MEAQIGLGADIIMAFDECTEYPGGSGAGAGIRWRLTLRWAERSKKYFEEHKHEVPWVTASGAPALRFWERAPRARSGTAEARTERLTQSLFGIVQGGMDLALRKESAERTIEIGFPGYAIGGLSVGRAASV